MYKITEQQNSLSQKINNMSISEILLLMNEQDALISSAINKEINKIEILINDIVNKIKKNGRLFYIGCGTSGRLGVLDASECPPTFSTKPELVQGIIAGGTKALYKSVEGAEDSSEEGRKIIAKNAVQDNDIIIGISANGSAPYVLSALEEAYACGATTCLIAFNKIDKNNNIHHLISIITGPEIISGSTRLKAGTATKMVLNMITTSTMIKLNKTYNNYMVDLKVSNKKLLERGLNIMNKISGLNKKDSKKLLDKAKGEVKTALVMNKLNCNYSDARHQLDIVDGNLGIILD